MFVLVIALSFILLICVCDWTAKTLSVKKVKTKVMKLSKHLRSAFTVMLMLVGVTFVQTAGATTKTYTVTGGQDNLGTGFYALFSDGSSSSGQVNWTYNSTAEISFSLPGGLTLKLSDTAKQLSVREGNAIGGRGATTFTVSSSSYYIYRVRLLDSKGNVIQLDANGNAVTQGGVSECDYWNMTKSFSHTFSNGILFSKIEVSYDTAIPITDAVITGLNSQYPVSNAAVTPTPTVTWHGTTLTNGTHYSLTYQNNTAAGTATVYATGKGIFSTSTSVSADYTLVWATYSVRFNKNNDAATGTMSNQAFTYSTAQALAANAFTRTGYTFAGWNTAANGSGTSYADGQSVSNLTATNGGTVDLYAQWTNVWGMADGADGSEAHPYVITTTAGLDLLAKNVNGTDGYTANDFSDTYFKLGDDISYTHITDWNDAASMEDNYTAIGGNIDGNWRYFRGTFDGQGHTVSGIRIYKGGTTGADSYQGLFGMTSGATIRNVILADARITGKQDVGGIAGYILKNNDNVGIVENCRVGSDVTIHAVADYAFFHGGVVGRCNGGTISGCVSAATLTVADGLTGIDTYGGIVGYLNGDMSDCLAIGASVPAVEYNGAIAGISYSTQTNTCYHGCTVGNAALQSDAYTVSAGTGVTLTHAGSPDQTYPHGGIQRYGSILCYGGVLYAPAGATVTLGTVTGYMLSNVTVSGTNTLEADGDGSIQIDPLTGDTISKTDDNPTPGVMRYHPISPNVIQVLEDTDGDGVPDTWVDYHLVWEDIDDDGLLEGGIDRDGDVHIDDVDGDNLTQQQPGGDTDKDPTDGIPHNSEGKDVILLHVDTDGDNDVDDDDEWVQLQKDLSTGVISPVYEEKITATDNGDGTWSFNMPDQNVTVAATVAVAYIDADGTEQSCTNYTLLTTDYDISNAMDQGYLPGGWYVVYGNIRCGENLQFSGDAHIILADGARLKTDSGIDSYGYDLAIYGQAAGSGELSVNSYTNNAIVCNNICINGGSVSATGSSYGIDASSNVTINGGNVSATSSSYGIYASGGTITLGWSSGADRITASRYNKNPIVKEGQTFSDGTTTYSGTVSSSDIAGKTLRPAVITSYVNEYGTLHENVISIPLDNTMTTLEAGTYVVNQDVTYTSPITTTGNVTLILADGCTMSIGTEANPLDATCMECGGNLNIYGQTQGTGWLKAFCNSGSGGSGICMQNNTGYNQYSGNVYIRNGEGAGSCIYTNNHVSLHGGTLDVQSSGACAGDIDAAGENGDYGIIQIEGGKLWARGKGLKAFYHDPTNTNIYLSWNNLTDLIYATSYNGSLEIKNTFVTEDGIPYNSGKLYEIGENHNINGKTLRPVNGVLLTNYGDDKISASFLPAIWNGQTVSIPASITVHKVEYERTFSAGKASTVMLPFSYTCDGSEGGTFYRFVGVEKENGKWVATMQATGTGANNAGTLTANTPYLFMPNSDFNKLNLTIPNEGVTLNTTGGGNCQTADQGSHWTFQGTYSYIMWTTDTEDQYYSAERAAEIGKVYGFAGVAKPEDNINVGDFVRVASGAQINPMRAYLMWSDTPNSAHAINRGASEAEELPSRITVRLLDADGVLTNVGEIDIVTGEVSFEGWYTLQGVKLDAEPTQPGIYINNGKKVSIK